LILSHKSTLSDTNPGSQDIPALWHLAEGLFVFYIYFIGKEEIINNGELSDIRRGEKIKKIAKY